MKKSTRVVSAKKNVIHFLASQELNGLYSGRVEKYLQNTGEVGWSFFADTVEAFAEITKSPESEWHLLIVDEERANSATATIDNFRNIHPKCIVVVFQKEGANPLPLESAITMLYPNDIDDWLHAMHHLLDRS